MSFKKPFQKSHSFDTVNKISNILFWRYNSCQAAFNYVFKLIGKLLKKVYVKFDLVIFKTINDTEKRVDFFDNLGKQLNYEE